MRAKLETSVMKRPLLVAVVVAVLLALPSLRSGLILDDHVHVATYRGEWPLPWWDIFRFLPGDAAQTQAWIARGALPWWTDPDVKIAFFRPISAALVRLDVELFGDRYALFHLHSVLWTAAWVIAAAKALRAACASFSSKAGSLEIATLLFFSVAPSHLPSVYWLASRNGIVASVFVLLALSAYVRYRAEGVRSGVVAAPLLFGAALLSGEIAIGGLGYFLAYEAFGAPRGATRRGSRAALLGPLVVTFVWLVVYRAMDYGTRATGFYFDPLRDPGAFLRNVPLHAITQLGTIVLLVPSHLGVFDPRVLGPQLVIGALSLAVLVALTRMAWREANDDERRTVTWLGVGGALAVIPSLASSPQPRSLAVGSFGFAVVVAFWAIGARRRMRKRGSALGPRVLFWALVTVHGILPALYWPTFAWFSQKTLRAGMQAALELPMRPGEGEPRLVLLTVSDPPSGLYVPLIRREAGLPPLARSWLLSIVPRAHRLTGIDDRTFELAPVGRRLLDTPFEKVLRPAKAVHVGDVWKLDGAEITVVEEEDGGPTRIRVRLEQPIDRTNVIAWTHGHYERIDRLAPGEVRILER